MMQTQKQIPAPAPWPSPAPLPSYRHSIYSRLPMSGRACVPLLIILRPVTQVSPVGASLCSQDLSVGDSGGGGCLGELLFWTMGPR